MLFNPWCVMAKRASQYSTINIINILEQGSLFFFKKNVLTFKQKIYSESQVKKSKVFFILKFKQNLFSSLSKLFFWLSIELFDKLIKAFVIDNDGFFLVVEQFFQERSCLCKS